MIKKITHGTMRVRFFSFLFLVCLFVLFFFLSLSRPCCFPCCFFFLLGGGILLGYNSTGQINEKIPCRCLILTQVNCSKKERGDIK